MCQGPTTIAQMDKTLKENSVVIISKTSCSYCHAVKDLLTHELGVKAYVIEVNEHPKGAEIQEYMKKLTQKDTVPLIFVKSKFLGNYSNIMDMAGLQGQSGVEDEEAYGLRCSQQGTANQEIGIPPPPPAAAPPLVSQNSQQMSDPFNRVADLLRQYHFLRFLSSPGTDRLDCCCIAWLLCSSICGVSKFSPMYKLGGSLLSNWEPVKQPGGAPKKFAYCCGIMFSGLGAAFYLTGQPNIGCGFMSILLLASGMEAVLDFWLGCNLFAHGNAIYQYFKKPSAKQL